MAASQHCCSLRSLKQQGSTCHHMHTARAAFAPPNLAAVEEQATGNDKDDKETTHTCRLTSKPAAFASHSPFPHDVLLHLGAVGRLR